VKAARLSIGVFALGICACSSSPDVLTYDEFKSQAIYDAEANVYVINGDELVEDEAGMQDIYQRYLDSVADAEARADGTGTYEESLIVNLVSGRDDKWGSSQQNNITYCVSQSSFGSRYSAVVTAMANAAAAWHATANITFVHVSSQDGNCNRRNNNVVFDVVQTQQSSFLARSFFPSSSRRSREVLISFTSFGNISPWTLTGVLRHELGHTLGFRHEHTRPESGTCFEDNNWRALTAYDSSSVMHYPQCNGTQNGDLVLTNLDKTGAHALYP